MICGERLSQIAKGGKFEFPNGEIVDGGILLADEAQAILAELEWLRWYQKEARRLVGVLEMLDRKEKKGEKK